MRVLFVARHNSGDNNDEGAIAYALEQLGHTVIYENEQRRCRNVDLASIKADALLFLKWEDFNEIERLAEYHRMFFWYFDLVSSQEDSLSARMHTRREWMSKTMRHVSAGFCTDGTWVRQNPDKPYYHLPQGADELAVGFGHPQPGHAPILFTGMIHHGQKRADHIYHLQERWGDKFEVLGDGGSRHRIHGCKLKDRLASSKIIVAPDGPVSDHYWSNRVYLTLGFGGFLLHPHCEGLREHYEIGTELQTYSSREELDDLIEYYLKDEHESERQRLMQAGYERTLKSNLYRHRCEELVKIMQERI